MGIWYDKALKAKEYIENTLKILTDADIKHEVAIVLGSGLGPLVDSMKEKLYIPYTDIPGFPVSTVPGHAGQLVSGLLGGIRILVMQGRFHIYEGYESAEVALPIRVFKLLGIDKLIVTNAAGAINRSFHKGQFMLIKDHISLFMPSPLRGTNEEQFGTFFPPMEKAYDREFLDMALRVAKEKQIDIVEGVYVYAQGPMFETPAEIRTLSILGADAVGMSTVPEVIVASHCGIRTLGITCLTNMAAGITGETLSHQEVNETGRSVEASFVNFVSGIIQNI